MVETISQRLPVTVKLTVVAVLFETLFGITAGIVAALRRNSFFDNLVLVSTTVLVAIPVFVLGFLAQYAFGFKLRWLPIAGVADGWISYLLPGLVLAALSMAYVARLTRTAMLEAVSADYIRTARAKGGIVTMMVFFYIFFNLLADVLCAVADPRIRYD